MGGKQNPRTRRNVVKSIGGAAAIAALAGCSGAGGGGGGSGGSTDTDASTSTDSSTSSGASSVEITLAGTGGSWGDARAKAFYDPFRNGEMAWDEEHKLTFSSVPSEQYTSSLKRSPENPQYDLVELDGQRAELLGKRGAAAKQADVIDNFDNVADAYKNDYMGGTTVFPRGLAYRKDKLDVEIEEWDDLIDPALRGKVSIGSWDQAGSKYFFAINHAKGGTLDDLEPGFNWLREFIDVTDPKITTSTDQAMQFWRNGEVYAAPFLSARVDQLRNDQGYDMAFAIPTGGMVMDYWGYPMMKHTSDDKKQVAMEFLEGAFDPEVQANFAESFGYPPATPDSYEFISDEAKERHPTMILSDEQISRFDMGIDWTRVAEMSPEVGQEWRKIVSQ